MRTILAAGFALVTAAACGGEITNDSGGDNGTGPDACVGLECEVAKCTGAGQTPTTITGTVFAPNGTLPLYGVDVYVPRDPLPPIQDGVVCGACQDLPGSPIVAAKTDEMGNFVLENVPAGDNIPLVLSIGKWRREVTIANVPECTSTPIAATQTRLPKNKAEGSIPKMAITTGSADALECLVRKLGIEDAEFTSGAGAGRVQLYAGNGVDDINGQQMQNATTLWSDPAKLAEYDLAIFSCEGGQNPQTKPQAAMDTVKQYADVGGRVFMSHWHNIWIEGSTEGGGNQAPAVWTEIATWNNSGTTFGGENDTIDEVSNPKGPAFADWMLAVGGSPPGQRGAIPIADETGKQTCTGVTQGRAERWVYWNDNGTEYPQNFQFTTPNEAAGDSRCGKVVFSDMHVSGDSSSPEGGSFPGSCSQAPLTPQEKALAFMFFDIASCVSIIGKQ